MTPGLEPPAFEELAKVPWHGLEIVRYKNAILPGSQCQHRRVGNSFKIGVVRGEKINCRLSTPATANDCVVEVGIRQEANHPLFSLLGGLAPDGPY
jgi:hypothetical protein